MKEKNTLQSLVRSSLEDGAAVSPRCLRTIEEEARQAVRVRTRRPLFLRWGAPLLAAASLTVALAFRSVLSPLGGSDSDRPDLADAIDLLCELDGISSDNLNASTTEELLIAWLDAPCAELL